MREKERKDFISVGCFMRLMQSRDGSEKHLDVQPATQGLVLPFVEPPPA